MIEFEPLPAGLEYVVLDLNRESTSSFHDEPLEMENQWTMEFFEAPTLEYEEKDFVDKHGCFILESPSPCSYNTLLESATFYSTNASEGYNHLKALSTKTLRRMVVDAYVYHKHCKFPDALSH